MCRCSEDIRGEDFPACRKNRMKSVISCLNGKSLGHLTDQFGHGTSVSQVQTRSILLRLASAASPQVVQATYPTASQQVAHPWYQLLTLAPRVLAFLGGVSPGGERQNYKNAFVNLHSASLASGCPPVRSHDGGAPYARPSFLKVWTWSFLAQVQTRFIRELLFQARRSRFCGQD